jgi:hypothetical protein
MGNSEYHNPERLADVMALIQVLSLAKSTKRSENGLQSELQRAPISEKTWTQVAQQHPEFFRVRQEDAGDLDAHRVSLIARAAMPKSANGERDPLASDIIGKLLDIAISLHDRETSRREKWKSLLPIAVAIVAGLFTIAAALFKAKST